MLFAHLLQRLQIIGAPVEQLGPDLLEPVIAHTAETAIRQLRVIQPKLLFARVSGLAFAPYMKLRSHALYRGGPLRSPRSSELAKILIRNAELPGLEVDLGLDAIPIAGLAAQVGIQHESGRSSLEQSWQSLRGEAERFDGVTAHRERPAKGVEEGPRVAQPRERLDGAKQIALAGCVGPEQDGQPR